MLSTTEALFAVCALSMMLAACCCTSDGVDPPQPYQYEHTAPPAGDTNPSTPVAP